MAIPFKSVYAGGLSSWYGRDRVGHINGVGNGTKPFVAVDLGPRLMEFSGFELEDDQVNEVVNFVADAINDKLAAETHGLSMRATLQQIAEFAQGDSTVLQAIRKLALDAIPSNGPRA